MPNTSTRNKLCQTNFGATPARLLQTTASRPRGCVQGRAPQRRQYVDSSRPVSANSGRSQRTRQQAGLDPERSFETNLDMYLRDIPRLIADLRPAPSRQQHNAFGCCAFHEKPRETCVSMTENSASHGARSRAGPPRSVSTGHGGVSTTFQSCQSLVMSSASTAARPSFGECRLRY
jgi:hypothetical protein